MARLQGSGGEASPYLSSLCANTQLSRSLCAMPSAGKPQRQGGCPASVSFPAGVAGPARQMAQRLAEMNAGARSSWLHPYRAKSGDAEQRGELTASKGGSDLPCQAQVLLGTSGLLRGQGLPVETLQQGLWEGVGRDQSGPEGDRCLLGTVLKPSLGAGTSRAHLLQ